MPLPEAVVPFQATRSVDQTGQFSAQTDEHFPSVQGDAVSLIGTLGKAIAAAAVEGRADVAAELALIVARVASEGRGARLAAQGVPTLDTLLTKLTSNEA